MSSLDGITRITPAVWKSHRSELVALVMQGLQHVTTSQQSGEEISRQSARLATYFMTASQSKNATLHQQALLWTMTEGRHTWPKYSACADLCHLVLSLMGITRQNFVNRDDDNFDGVIDADEAKSTWVVAQNISKLIDGAKVYSKELKRQVWVPATQFERPEIGDLIWIGGPAGGGLDHVMVAQEWDNDVLISVDGGQVDDGGQCVTQRKRAWIIKTGRPWLRASTSAAPAAAGLGERGVNGWISISALWDCFDGQGWEFPE
jgi:hypothetical protein